MEEGAKDPQSTTKDRGASEDSPNKTIANEKLLFINRAGIRRYALTKGKDTEQLLKGAIVQAANLLATLEKEIKEDILSSQEFANRYAPKIVAEVTASHMSSGLSIPRVLMGGKYKLEDVIKATSCIDAAVFTREVLKQGFDIDSEIKTIRLGVVPTHHYLRLEGGEIIDPIVGSKKNPGGYYKSEEKFNRTISVINSGGLSAIKKQVLRLVKPNQKPNTENDKESATKS